MYRTTAHGWRLFFLFCSPRGVLRRQLNIFLSGNGNQWLCLMLQSPPSTHSHDDPKCFSCQLPAISKALGN